MRNLVKIGTVDTLPALAEIRDEMWLADTYLKDYPQGPFGEVKSIILRFPPRINFATEEERAAYAATHDIWECEWLPVSRELTETKQLVFDLARNLEATRIGRVIINRMGPGDKIERHADTPAHANYWTRMHIVMHALPGNDFFCGSEMVNMLTDEVWYLANENEHEVINNSTDPRIHLVIDLKTDLK